MVKKGESLSILILSIILISGCIESSKDTSFRETISSTPTAQPNRPPIAVVFASPISINEEDSVGFSGASSTDSDGYIVSYQWNFGDGESGMGTTLSHKYLKVGTYVAILTVIDNDGLKDIDSIKIFVYVKPKPIVYGYITTIALDKMGSELIDLNDNYGKYEVENNIGTINYHGYTYQTHRVTLWQGDLKKIINNAISYELTTTVPSSRSEPKVFGFVTTITFDEKTELIKFDDGYDKYDVENNVGTIDYRGYIHVTNSVTLWRGDTKRIINNVVAYSLGRRYFY